MYYCLSGRVFEPSPGSIPLSPREFFRLSSKAGFSAVELRRWQVAPENENAVAAEIRTLSAQYSLPVEMITFRGRNLETRADYEYFLRYLELAERLECRQMKISGSPEMLLKAAERAAASNVRLGINNHVHTPLETVSGMLEFLRKVAHPNFFLLFDPSHLWLMREAVTPWLLAEIIPRISYVVVQDYVETAGSSGIDIGLRRVRPVKLDETGEVGYQSVLSALEELGYDGPVGLVQPGLISSAAGGKQWLRENCSMRNFDYEANPTL